MLFDLFFEIPLGPARGVDEARAYRETLAQIELGDRLGFDCAWLVEHHFTRDYSHCSKPELVLAAASQRTQRIRLGHAIIPLPLHHPIHVAERAATLDVLCAGRLELGIGRGFAPAEYAAFGQEMAYSRALTEEALKILRLSFRGDPLSHAGRFWHFNNCDVLPKFVQTPHPPLWTAAVSPDSFTWAAAEDLGVLVGPFKPWPMVRHDIGAYRKRLASHQHGRVGLTVGVVCLEDGARARRIARDAFTWFYRRLYELTAPVLERLYPSYEQIHSLGRFRKLLKLGIDLGFLETFGLAVAGTPQQCIRRLSRFHAAGVTRVLCSIGAGVVEPQIAEESMRLLAREVRPAFTDGARVAMSPEHRS